MVERPYEVEHAGGLVTTTAPCQVEQYHSPATLLNIVHHIRPKSWGGARSRENEIVVCGTTHYTLHVLLDSYVAYAELLLDLQDPSIAGGFSEIRLPLEPFAGSPKYFYGIRHFSPAVRRLVLQGWQAWCGANPGKIPPPSFF